MQTKSLINSPPGIFSYPNDCFVTTIHLFPRSLIHIDIDIQFSYSPAGFYTKSHSKDNAAARRRLRRRIIDTLRKPTTMPTKLAKDRMRIPQGSEKKQFLPYR